MAEDNPLQLTVTLADKKQTNVPTAPPAGFKLDAPSAPPPGFKLDAPPGPSAPPSGFKLDAPVSAPPSPFDSATPTEPETKSKAAWAVEPLTSYWPTYQEMQKESREQVSKGVEQLGEGEKLSGAANVALGGAGYVMSPVSAGLRSVVGRPVERATGIPKEYTEFATGLALPGLGMAKTPKTLQRIFSPETVSQDAMDAAATIRQYSGEAARRTATSASNLESYEKMVNRMSPADQLDIQRYVDGVPGVSLKTPEVRALADELKAGFKERRTILEGMPATQQAHFMEEYFPHFWKDPNAAANFVRQYAGGAGKQGSGASLKARTMPTIDDGLAAGLEPLYTNPVEAAMRYFESMDKFIASTEMLQTGKDTGKVVYIRPTVMGASGRQDSLKIPQGYAPLEGRGSTNAVGEKAYAPEDWARVYNNFISRGWDQIGGGEYGVAYNALRRGSNAITQAILSFIGYHAFTMAEATMSNQMAKTVREIRHVRPGQAMKEFGKVFTAPVAYASKGKKLSDVYLGKTMPVSPQDKEIVDLITQAGGRMHGIKHALDYDASALGSYFKAFKRGRLQMELATQYADIKAHPVLGTARTAASNIGRIMDTFNQPIFQHYIPSIKNAAAYENMAQWMKLNPNAGQAEKLKVAREIVDSVDNRFGEMIHDNIFWNKVAKQSAMLGMLSYSWNMGGIREIGGGVRDFARAGVGKGGWTAKMDYTVGMALNWGMMSAIYQYIKTGEAPRDLHDLAAPRTGGIDERTGQPERIIPPGIMKDVFGYYEHFGQEVINKVSPAAKLAGNTASILVGMGGSDWRDDPILSPREEGQTAWNKAPQWLAEYFNFVIKSMTPIQMQNLTKGKERGSNLSDVEKALGIRTAPRQLVDPEGQEAMRRGIWTRKWRGKERHDRREEERYNQDNE